MAEIFNISPISPISFEFQDYSISDTSLITNLEVQSSFNSQTDKVEYFIYDLNGNIIYENLNFPGYKLIDNNLTLDPGQNIVNFGGITEGQYNTVYNFISPKLASSPEFPYFISDISPDRTELRLDTTSIPNELVISSSLELIKDITTSTGSYYDFYLDFGQNDLVIATNVLLDTSSINNPTVLIKLYEPLPIQFNLQTQVWAATQVASSVAYNIQINQVFENINDKIYLKGPNTNINIQNEINNSTSYTNYNTLKSTTGSYVYGTGSLQYQLNNILAQTGIQINIDYSDYSNFIHFSSAQARLENFYYKLQLLETYTYSASLSSGSSSATFYVSSSNIIWQNKINEIITTFDNYEYYLYYQSGSTCWPKTGNTPPYTNVTTNSVIGLSWFATQSVIAEEYDLENNNALVYAIPSYILEDSDNAKFELFVEMIGQSFDNIFVYLQDVTNKYNADNRLNYGVSKDLVVNVLRDMGVKIYQNNFSSNDLYQALIGITPSGSLYNLPFTTTQYPVPTGSFLEYITTYVTASSTSSLSPTDDINKEQYKRIYHNLPLLFKKKGSVEGLRDLITTFGIPDTILRINEFGGKDRNQNSYDNWQAEYNYNFYTSGSAFITSSFVLNTNWGATNNRPSAIEFRFKTTGLPTDTGYYSQSLWSTDNNVNLRLRYTGSGYTSGSYSGSVVDPYYQYALLDFIPNSASLSTSASVYLPFYEGGWWSVLVNNTSTGFDLFVKNKNYEGEDGNTIGFQASSSITTSNSTWVSSSISYFGTSSLSGKIFSGSFQEIRYYSQILPETNFDAYVMNPYSIESSENLAFRASLGGELYMASISIHPKISGSWITTSSFTTTNNFYTSSGGIYIPNTEVFYFDQVPAGIQNAISDKIKQQAIVLPYSSSIDPNIPNANVLSPYISVQQQYPLSSSYTRDIDYVEIGFSPQNEINTDINSQLGYFNIGELIGDPRFQSSSLVYYPDLDAVRDGYFQKYISNYQEWNYIRLIEFFDNSLFKMFQDWVPARASLASGIIIKQTLLERNRYRVPQVNLSASIAFVGSGSTNIPYIVEDQTITGSIEIGNIEAGSGGAYDNLDLGYYSVIASTPSLILTASTDLSYVFNLQHSTSHIIISGSGVMNGTGYFYIIDGLSPTGSVLYSTNSLSFNLNITVTSSTGYLLFLNEDLAGGNEVILTNLQLYNTYLVSNYQSWSGSTPSILGTVGFVDSTQTEFYNGELSGSNVIVTNGKLDNCKVELIEVYSTASIPISDFGTPFTTFTIPNFKFNFDKTYYFSFDVNYNPSVFAGGVQIYDNIAAYTSRTIYTSGIQSSSFAASPFVEVQGIINPLYFSNTYFGPATLTNFKVYESYVEPDCLVISGDVESSRPNPNFYDVDYTQGLSIPVNYANIITASLGSGSATPSTVPQSNYTTARIINPRYLGCKNTSPDFNTLSGSQKPSVEQLTSYFAYTPGGYGGTLAERSGSGNYRIGFLVDENGAIYKPDSLGSVYLPTMADAFAADSEVVISPIDTPTSTVTSSYIVYKPNVLLGAILYSDSGSYGHDYLYNGYYQTMNFNIDPSIYSQPFGLNVTQSSDYNIAGGSTQIATLTNVILDQAHGFNTTTSTYTTQSTYPVKASLTSSFTIKNTSSINNTADVLITLYQNATILDSRIISALPTGSSQPFTLNSSIFLNLGDTIYIQIQNLSGFPTPASVTIKAGKLIINPVANPVVVTTPYFTTSSTTTSELVSSAALGSLYGSYQQTPITGTNFSTPPLLTIQPYDEIRFEGNESLVSTIISCSFDSTSQLFHIFLNEPIDTTAVNVQYFVIRRSYFSLDNLIINSPNTVTQNGFIIPKYPSQKLKEKLPEIIADLSYKGLTR